jgi:uncharacterized protein YutE (UPF0331/DUF86 family)
MVDAERAEARIERLEEFLERLETVRARGEAAYLADPEQQAMTERWLQLAVQVCIDLGAQIASERSAPPPSDYADVFTVLRAAKVLPDELAQRLGEAARQRNLLVHLYMEIDSRAVFASLDRLDDLRQFAAIVEELLADPDDPDSTD